MSSRTTADREMPTQLDSPDEGRAVRRSHGLSRSHVFNEHPGVRSGVLRNPRQSVCVMSTLELVYGCGVVCLRVRRGGGAVLTDFLPGPDCPVELHLSKNRAVMFSPQRRALPLQP